MPQFQQYPEIEVFSGQELILYAQPTGSPSAPYQTVYSTVTQLLGEVSGSYLLLTGGTMTGPLVLYGDPQGPLEAVTRDYAQGLIAALGNLSTLSAGAGLTVSGTELIVAEISDGEVLANITGSAATPVGVTVSALLDAVASNTHGAILFRGAAGWEALAPGTSGYVLTTDGAAADPHWAATGTPSGWPGGMDTGLTATGNSYGTALQLTAGWNTITATTGAAPSVILTADASFPCTVVNKSASAIEVRPLSGGQIDSYGADATVTIPANGGALTFTPRGGLTQWDSS